MLFFTKVGIMSRVGSRGRNSRCRPKRRSKCHLANFLIRFTSLLFCTTNHQKNERERQNEKRGNKRKKSFSINSIALYLIGSPINFRKSGAYLEPV